jgi:hypothetical protein
VLRAARPWQGAGRTLVSLPLRLAPRPFGVEANNTGVTFAHCAALFPQRGPLGDEFRDHVVVCRRKRPSEPIDRGLEHRLIGEGANGGANGGSFALAPVRASVHPVAIFAWHARQDSNLRPAA